jgi:hypothetical protein
VILASNGPEQLMVIFYFNSFIGYNFEMLKNKNEIHDAYPF